MPLHFSLLNVHIPIPCFTNPSLTKPSCICRGQTGLSELEDYAYNPAKPRRRTNSSTAAAGHAGVKTKFEAVDPEVIEFEEDLHGPSSEDVKNAASGAGDDGLEKMSTSSSADTFGSVEEEDAGAVGEKK